MWYLQPNGVNSRSGYCTDPNYKPPRGHLGNLEPVQQNALDTLKEQFKDEGYFVPERMDDATLLRFLRSCGFDVEKTKAMILSAEEWRKDFGVDDILVNFEFTEKAEVDKYFPQYYHKTDKDGQPIYVMLLGKVDVDALNSVTTKDRQLRRFVLDYEKFVTERLPSCAKAVGHPIETSCTIIDLDGVSIGTFFNVQDYVIKTTKIGQNYYPGCTGKVYIVNVPWTFNTVWSIIKPFLRMVKIEIVGRGAAVKEKLLSQIPAENLPAKYGGTCQCVGGCSLSDAGPWNLQTGDWETQWIT